MRGLFIHIKRLFLLGIVTVLIGSCTKPKTELILLGTVHQPVENFNADSLYNILVRISPDVILYEVDSSFFTDQFEFNTSWKSNEYKATSKYANLNEVIIRPYDFTGRNEYRKAIGARPTDGLAKALLDSLYQTGLLNPADQLQYESYLRVNDTLNALAYYGAASFNNPATDSIAQSRQQLQYESLAKIMEQYPVFSDIHYQMENGDSISFLDGYKRAGEFWKMRNEAMSKHILHFVKTYPGKRILVLNGFFHRYYLNKLLLPVCNEHDFVIKNFDEY
ncbi:MAG: hypothetical protein R8N23_08325 [Reichenbachiella sp.]|uniref:hypothetical protein n=1 Tax=Reichenbachiella sp. TaxID=2184521 RepID=UPI002965E6A0|nr:hypothetical protein [Reichenbachiella sp.]MDW3209859.1 hypothetical protein [Reichenbachiella sp.]